MPAYLYCDCCYFQQIILDDPEAMVGKIIRCRSCLYRMEVKVRRFRDCDPVYSLGQVIEKKEQALELPAAVVSRKKTPDNQCY